MGGEDMWVWRRGEPDKEGTTGRGKGEKRKEGERRRRGRRIPNTK